MASNDNFLWVTSLCARDSGRAQGISVDRFVQIHGCGVWGAARVGDPPHGALAHTAGTPGLSTTWQSSCRAFPSAGGPQYSLTLSHDSWSPLGGGTGTRQADQGPAMLYLSKQAQGPPRAEVRINGLQLLAGRVGGHVAEEHVGWSHIENATCRRREPCRRQAGGGTRRTPQTLNTRYFPQ